MKFKPTYFIFLLLVTCLTIILFNRPAQADDAPAIAPPPDRASTSKRHTQVLSRSHPNGKISIHIFPWVDADGKTARSWIETISSRAVSGKKVTSGVHTVFDVPNDELVYVVRDVRAKRGSKRASIQFSCAGRGKLRLVDSYMDIALLQDGRQAVTVPPSPRLHRPPAASFHHPIGPISQLVLARTILMRSGMLPNSSPPLVGISRDTGGF